MIHFNPCPKPAPREKKPRKFLKRSPLKKVNRERRKRLFEEDFGSKEYLAFIHSLPCAVCNEYGWTQAAHTKSRGAGGKVDDVAPLCGNRLGITGCHARYDDHDPEVRQYELMLRSLAKQLRADWLEGKFNDEFADVFSAWRGIELPEGFTEKVMERIGE